MRKLIAFTFFATGIIIDTGNEIAIRVYPDKWGGPNILAGLIQLVAYAIIIDGIVLLFVAYRHKQ